MSSEVLVVTVVAIRVLFLVLFCGAYLWFILAFESGTQLLPPPQRLEIIRGVEKRFLLVSWLFVVFMSLGGLGSMFVLGPIPDLNSILSTPQGIVLGLEAVITLFIIICNALIQFIFLPRAKDSPILVAESGDKALKWLTAKDSKAALSAISGISFLSIVNIVLAIVAIALGVVFSNI
jgi:uncharacterized membrane protein